MDKTNDGAWFAPKRFGWGTGRPLTWQGWATFAVNGALIAAGAPLLHLHRTGAHAGGQHHLVFAVYVVIVMLGFLPLYAAKTRGGLRWRWKQD